MKSCGHSLEFQERPDDTLGETENSALLAVPNFAVRRIKLAEAKPFILNWHYSKTVPTGDNIFFGCYVGGTLYAVANYGRIASRTEPSVVLGRDDATPKNTLELRRFCRLGEKGEALLNSSELLNACHAELRKFGCYRYVLSYSDQKYNKFDVQFRRAKHKSGGLYKHAGFEWIGETPEEWHVEDKDGNQFHRSRAYRKMLAHNIKLCGGDEKIPRKKTGNEDRLWDAMGVPWATDAEVSISPSGELSTNGKLCTLEQVRDAMGFKRVRCPHKDKWLLTL